MSYLTLYIIIIQYIKQTLTLIWRFQ